MIYDLVDVETDPHNMIMEDNWKYLGDILSSDGKNDANIKARTYRGLGAITNIFQTLKEICLGRYFYEAATEMVLIQSAPVLPNTPQFLHLSFPVSFLSCAL